MNIVNQENMVGAVYYAYLLEGNTQAQAARFFQKAQSNISLSVKTFLKKSGLKSCDKRKLKRKVAT